MYALAARRSHHGFLEECKWINLTWTPDTMSHRWSLKNILDDVGRETHFSVPAIWWIKKTKVWDYNLRKNLHLAPSRNIIFIFYEAFFITPPQHTLYITHYEPQAAMLWCASQGLAAFPWVAQQHWQKRVQSCPVPVALCFVQGKHAANVAPRDTKALY